MLLVSLNAIFAFVFLGFAMSAIRRAFPFLNIGWARDRKFFLAGVAWLISGLVAAGLGVYFIVQTLASLRAG
jgi:hypothetical protein